MLRAPAILVDGLAKTFTLYNQGGAGIPVFDRLQLSVKPGECVVLAGESRRRKVDADAHDFRKLCSDAGPRGGAP